MEAIGTIGGILAVILAIWLALNGDSVATLLIFLGLGVYLRERYFWPWPFSIEDKYDKLVKELTKEAETYKPAKEDSWKWKLHLKNLLNIHDLYPHLIERYKHKKVLKDIRNDWTTYIRRSQNLLNLRYQGWDTLEGKQLRKLQDAWRADEIVLEEIEKRFEKLNTLKDK